MWTEVQWSIKEEQVDVDLQAVGMLTSVGRWVIFVEGTDPL